MVEHAACSARPAPTTTPAELFAGSFAITTPYVAAVVCALQAFGGARLAQIGLVYRGVSAVAASGTVPGGLGDLEAASSPD